MKASRWITLGAVAVGVAVVAPQLWTPAATAPAVAPRPVEPARAEPATDYGRLLRRDSFGEPTGRAMFGSTSEPPRAARPKPVVAAAPEAPAPATVPQFPYRWAGRVELGRALHRAYFMRANGDLVSVLPGEVIDGVWRIDRLTGEQVEVTYLPLAKSFPLALAQLSADRDGAATPSAQPVAQIAPGAEQRSLFERRPLAPEATSAAGGPARPNPTGMFGSAAIAPAAAGAAAAPAAASRGSSGPAVSSAAAPAAAGRLGSEVPTSGSMPAGPNADRSGLTVADANARGIAGGAMPTGRLGEATPTGKLGAD